MFRCQKSDEICFYFLFLNDAFGHLEEKGPCRRQNYYCSVLNFHGDAGDEEKVKEQLRKVNRGDMPPHLFIYFFSAIFI